MTRRKRTPSPSPASPQKRVAFEIPPSLQQFSTISRSLANSRDSHSAPTSSQAISNGPRQTQPQPRGVSQSSTQAGATLSAGTRTQENARSDMHSQQRHSTGAQSWPQSSLKNNPNLAGSRRVDDSGKQQGVNNSFPSSNVVQSRDPSANPSTTSPQLRRESMPTRFPAAPEEPPLKPGETPTLATHPNLIAQLVAKKRAENEAMGVRELWARRQAEYRMSKSPASQSLTEPNKDLARIGNQQPPQSRAFSNPLPARPPIQPPVPAYAPYAPAASRIETRAPATENRTAPAVEEPGKGTDTSKAPRASGETDSLFGSPFSEFLEKATDNAGLKDGNEPSSAVSAGNSAAPTPVPQGPDAAQSRPASSHQPSETNKPPTGNVTSIPPLFSDKPKGTGTGTGTGPGVQAPTPQNRPYHRGSGNSGPNVSTPQHQNTSMMQRQSQAHATVPSQPPSGQAPRQDVFVMTPSVASSHSSAGATPRRHPYFEQTPTPGGYYKVDFRVSADGTTSTTAIPAGHASLPYGKPLGPPNAGYPGYVMGMMPVYQIQQQPQPMPGQVPVQRPAYGGMAVGPATGTVAPAAAAPVAAAQPSKQQQQHSSGTNVITQADRVAGINMRFKISTQNDFSVPKR
ncbi:hypothetical protein ABEF93_005293 [Exophiala dermatitidis]